MASVTILLPVNPEVVNTLRNATLRKKYVLPNFKCCLTQDGESRSHFLLYLFKTQSIFCCVRQCVLSFYFTLTKNLINTSSQLVVDALVSINQSLIYNSLVIED